MKHRGAYARISGILAVFLLLFPLLTQVHEGCGNQASADSELLIAAASDLHVNPNLGSSISVLQQYQGEIIDALLWDARNMSVDVLLLCGDITNAGRVVQHETLLEKLKKAEAEGLRILAIPGNHDIGEIRADQFDDLYADFGYAEAYTRDDDSLSYSYYLNGVLFLMLDTDGYSERGSGAYVSGQTLAWIEKQLQTAKEKHWDVLPVGHYSVLTGQTSEFVGQQQIKELFDTYRIPLYLCGHLHQRHVAYEDGLTELVVEQTTDYPCGYAMLQKTDGYNYSFAPKTIDMSTWAKENGIEDHNLLNFEEYEEELFLARCKESIEILRKGQPVEQERLEMAADFLWQMESGYWKGTLSSDASKLKLHPGYEALMEIAAGTVYGRWVPSALEGAVPYTAGFTIEDGCLVIQNDD